jgi:hypothetical protein
MKTKFVMVSKDTSFKMLNAEFEKVDDSSLVSVEYVMNNTDALAVVYNKFLREARSSNDVDRLVLMHSDVSFNVQDFIKHLDSIDSKYDVIGLCGTSILNVSQSPLNWWNGSNPTPYAKWGCVTHGELKDHTSYFSNHSPNVLDHEVSCIDGLCIIFTKTALDTTLEFDESVGKFDFYDTDISMQAVMNYKLKLGVMVRMDLCHYSVGRSIMTSDFLENEIKFRNKWNLPIPPDSAVARHIEMKNQQR